MLRADTPSLRARLTRRPADADWRQSLTLFAAIMFLLAGFGPVIRGGEWWTTSVLFAGFILVTCVVLRSLHAPLTWLIALVVWFTGLVWIFVPETLFGVLPTLSSFGALGDLWVSANRILAVESPPVAPAQPVILVITGLAGLIAIVLDALQLGGRKPVVVGAVFTAMFVVPVALAGERPNVWLFLGIAGMWLVLLRSEVRGRDDQRLSMSFTGASATVVIALAALALSVALPPVLPRIANSALTWGDPPPGVFERGINPILQLGQNLRRSNPVVAAEYTTTMDRPPYLKVANLLDFSGKTWRPSDAVNVSQAEGGVSLDTEIPRREVSTRIAVKNLSSTRLPVPYPGVMVDGLTGDWRWERQGLLLTSNTADSRNQTYTVTSLVIEPTRQQMRNADAFVGPLLSRYVRLPNDMPAIISRTAREVTAGMTSDYDKAGALQSYLRDGDFVYSETAPVAEGYDGNGIDVIAEFLKVKSGYCVHFASAMAVMARSLNIPARIAVGYAPGADVRVNRAGDRVFQVTSDDLHAWPELYFDGVGWTQFDPTTSVGSATSFSDPLTGSDSNPGQDGGSTATDEGRSQTRGLDATETASDETASSSRPVVVVLTGLLIMMLLPAVLRQARRHWRLRPSKRSACRLWIELEDTARDYSLFVSPADTPRVFAGQLSTWPGMDEEALQRLLSAVERERFGPPGDPLDDIADFRLVVAGIRGNGSNLQRLRAGFFPRSLFGQTTYAPRPQPV